MTKSPGFWIGIGWIGCWIFMIILSWGPVWIKKWKEHKAKKLAVWLDNEKISERLDILLDIHRHDINGTFLLDHHKLELDHYELKKSILADMDILSRRITNAFDYIGDLRSEYKAHETRFHTPKKPAEKKKGKK